MIIKNGLDQELRRSETKKEKECWLIGNKQSTSNTQERIRPE